MHIGAGEGLSGWTGRKEPGKVATQRRWGVVPEGGHAHHLECHFGAEQDAGL